MNRRLPVLIAIGLFVPLSAAAWAVVHKSTGVVVDDAAPTLGILVDRHLKVISVDPWGPARRAGIEPGDILRMMGSPFRFQAASLFVHPTRPSPQIR